MSDTFPQSSSLRASPSSGETATGASDALISDAPNTADVPTVSALMAATLFVGFATLEEWALAVEPSRPVLATKLVVPGSRQRGLQTDELLVVCQQVTPEGHILYCQLRAASLTRLCGEPFDPDWRERQAAWDSLWTCVRAFLAERDLTIQRATVAHPHGHVLFQGRSETIRFDAHSGRYFRPAFPETTSSEEVVSEETREGAAA